MTDAINKILFYIKVILLLVAFTLSLYIIMMMYDRFGRGIMDLILLFIPMLLSLITFVVSFFFKDGNKSILFNVSTVLALLAIVIICIRALIDKNMVLNIKDGINYYYFENQLRQIKILMYMIFFGNLVLFYKERKKQ